MGPKQSFHLLAGRSLWDSTPFRLGCSKIVESVKKSTCRLLEVHSGAAVEQGLHWEGSMISSLIIPEKLWLHVLGELRKRSAGWRESAGILVGKRQPDGTCIASDVVFHHDLADDRATALSLELPEAAKFKLYEDLSKRKLTLVSLIHTHPEDWVGLSEVDKSNRISSTVGFWSIVVPNYGNQPWALDQIGFHILEPAGWRELTTEERSGCFQLEMS
jgi:proteasome lid subunit RPN8/RPN11